MEISHITLLFFVMFSALRIISYLPQIYRVAADENGASAISYSTWALWVAANVSTALYAGINLRDPYLAFVSVIYATCCVTVIVLTAIKRRSHRGVDPPRETSRATAMAIEALHLADAVRTQARSRAAMEQRVGA